VRPKPGNIYLSLSLVLALWIIDVNYVNVNAFYFYFTPILVEIDVKDNFYVLPCSYSQKG
jgi:hypothetical protein